MQGKFYNLSDWGCVVIAYREKDYIRPFMTMLESWGIKNVVLLYSEKPFFGEPEPDDGTADIAEEMGALVIRGSWKSDDEMFNLGARILRSIGVSFSFLFAPDEYLCKHDAYICMQVLPQIPEGALLINKMNTYWKKPNLRIEPREGYKPCIAFKTDLRFIHARSPMTKLAVLPEEIVLHHFSYVHSNEQMFRKLNTFSHAPEIIKGWYENIWLKWNEDMRDLHPVKPSQYHKVVSDEPPREILDHLRYHPLFDRRAEASGDVDKGDRTGEK